MKTKKNYISAILLLFIFSLQFISLNANNIFRDPELMENGLAENYEGQEVQNAFDGLYEEKNFIPDGVYSDKFNPSVWTYDSPNSYSDTYWGDGTPISGLNTQSTTDTQNWNPFNDYLYDSNSYVAGSEDFEDLGVGAIQLDSARRDMTFSLNNTDMNESTGLLDITETTPNSVGYLSNGDEFNSTGRSVYGNSLSNCMMYTADWTFQDNPRSLSYTYPANTYQSGTTLGPTLVSSTDPPSGGYGSTYGDEKITPKRSYDVDYDQDTISINASRKTWWHLYLQSAGEDGTTIDNTQYVNAYWDTSFDYSTEIRMYFYYDQTTDSTNAYYGADVILNEFGELEYHPLEKVIINANYGGYEIANETFYQTDIDGTLTYDVWEYNGGTPTLLPGTQVVKTFSENSGTGEFDDDPSVAQSSDFGAELDASGWYFLQMSVDLTHHQYGYFHGLRNDPNHIDNAIYEYFEQENGITVDIVEPFVQISESTPYDIAPSPQQILMTSDPVNWGSKRSILPDTPANLTFGYQIPTDIKSANLANLSDTLENARVFAILEICDNSTGNFGADHTFINYSTNTFADVRGASSAYGTGCDKFSWLMDSTQRDALDNSGRIRWKIGIEVASGMELSYFTDSLSKVYFSNIDFTVQTEIFIDTVFTVKDQDGRFIDQLAEDPTVSEINFTLYDINDPITRFYRSKIDFTNGQVAISGMYNSSWGLIIKIKYPGLNSLNYTVYNSTYILDSSVSAVDHEIICNLTNVDFYVPDLPNGNVIITNIDNPNLSYSSSVIDDTANFTEIPFGDWNVILKTENDNVVANFTKNVDYFYHSDYGWKIFHLYSNNSMLQLSRNLTNAQLNVIDPLGSNIVGATVLLTNIDDESIVKTAISDSNGNVTLTEVYETTNHWQLEITSSAGNVIYDNLYQVKNSSTAENEEMIYDAILCNLTTIQFTINDYSGTGAPLSNDVSPYLQLSNLDGTTFEGYLDNGVIEFTEVYNSTQDDSWNVVVNVTAGTGQQTILDFPLLISTADDYIYEEFVANLTTYELTVYDHDGAIIPDATVNFTDNADALSTFQGTTDASGKVSFSKMYDASWNVWVNYTVGSESSSLSTDYTIYEDLTYNGITPENQEFILTDSLLDCNLTTFNLMVWDSNDLIAAAYRGLYNANVTLRNYYTGVNVSYFQSDAQGNITIRCPLSTYNISVNYQDKARMVSISPINNFWGYDNWTIECVSEISKTVFVSLSEHKTSLTNTGLVFGRGSDGWSNVHSSNQTSDPTEKYFLSMYYNDSVTIELFFYNLRLSSAVSHSDGDTIPYWKLYDGDILIDDSFSEGFDSFDTATAGYYNFTLDSALYGAGTYELIFEIGGIDGTLQTNELQNSTFICDIRILNHTTNFERLTPEVDLTKHWDENIILNFNYTIVLPVKMNVTDSFSTISYSIEGTSYVGTIDNSVTSGSSVYQLIINQFDLDVGSYNVIFNAEAANITAQALTFTIHILPVETTTETLINSSYRISDSYLRTSLGENITTYLNYTYTENSSAVLDSSIAVYLDSVSNPIGNYLETSGEWQFNCTIEASSFSVGMHQLIIITEKTNHENSTIIIDVDILSTWATTVGITKPPSLTSWSNNATFIVYYECSSEPRLNQPLSDAEISQLSITYMDGTNEVEKLVLLPEDTSSWNWVNLQSDSDYGAGYYQIEMNTSIIDVVDTSLFYLIPSVQQSTYALATARPYFSITPVSTSLTILYDNAEIQAIELYYDDVVELDTIMNVTESTSSIFSKLIDGAVVEYDLYNASQPGSPSLERGALEFTENGHYNFTFLASKVGSFTIELSMELTNYSLSEKSSISLTVLRRPVDFTFTLSQETKIASNALKIAQSEVLSINVQFLSFLETYPSLSASIGSIGLTLDIYEINTGEYICNGTIVGYPVGEYTLLLSAQMDNTESKIVEIEVEIMNYWKTEIEVVKPPIIYPWGENSFITVKYYCSDDPRSDLALAGAEITGLNITSIQGEKETLLHALGPSTEGNYWGWAENTSLGIGYYDIWFNTGIVSVATQTVFYVIPMINVSVYEMATAYEHLIIEPLETTLLPLSNSSSSEVIEVIDIELDEEIDIGVKLFVSDTGSHLQNKLLNDAGVIYYIYDLANNITVELSDGDLSFDSNGFYKFHYDGIALGSYRVKVISNLMNHTNAECTFDIIVNTKTIDIVSLFDTIAVNKSINTPQNQEIVFTIVLGIEGADVVLSFNNRDYILVEGDELGVYSYTFTPEDLKSHEVNSYLAELSISKENYTTIEDSFTFAINLPVDPYFGVTYNNWIIIGSTLAAVVTIIMVQQGIKRARIPLIIKQITETKKDMEKLRKLPDENISLSANDEIVEILADRWQVLDLDLATILGTNKSPLDNTIDITVSDEEAGGL